MEIPDRTKLSPERKSPTEALDIQQKTEEIITGQRPVDDKYPYIAPDYRIPFLHIGTERQLFLDNFILDHFTDVQRVIVKPKHNEESVLEIGGYPWERRRAIPQAALYDPEEGKFKMWYTEALSDDPYGDSGQILCYAEATDPLHWEKPLSEACIPYQEHKATNIVLQDASHHIVLVRNHDQSNPEQKYLMVYNPGDRAKVLGKRVLSTAAASPDGLRWTTISEDTPFRHHHLSRALWDESLQKYLAYSQYSHHWNMLYRKRQVGRQESSDFIHWSPKEPVLSVDWDPNLPPSLEFHDMSVRKVGGLYIGIASQFLAEPLWNVSNDVNWRDTAFVTLALYVSRDSRRWQRVSGLEPWIETEEPGNIHAGHHCFTLSGQLVHNGKTIVLYSTRLEKQNWFDRPAPTPIVPETAFQKGKEEYAQRVKLLKAEVNRGRAVSALVLREDGWAELRPLYEQGQVITRQFVFEGNTLHINANVAGGFIRVELLDPYFQPYPGFSASDCDPIHAPREEIWHTVSWQGNRDVSTLWDKPVRIVFHLHQAGLYAFQFVEG
jgi:hypothetical protein